MRGRQVLVVGGGGREHALAWALARSASVGQVYVAPGNAGTAWAATSDRAACSRVPISVDDTPTLVAFAQTQAIDLTVIGPEAPLANGIVDAFQAGNLCAFGPTQAAAQLESSKAFSKAFMQRCSVPTAAFGTFTDYEAARQFVVDFGRSVVVKADGLAAGKGVIVCESLNDAFDALRRIMIEREFGAAGDEVIIEERLTGAEVSAMAFCDGERVALMPIARDHKRIFDGDRGANTGGMGAFAPVPDLPPDFAREIEETVLKPILRGMAEQGTPYVGVLYAGLMLTPDGVRVLEYNCRFGDPETQVVLPLLKDDLAEIMIACVEGRLSEHAPTWLASSCATVVLASPGYPGSYPKGLPIYGLGGDTDDVIVFHAGTAEREGQVVTAGGRALAVSGIDTTLDGALRCAYQRIESIHFEGMQFRRDIGQVYQEVHK